MVKGAGGVDRVVRMTLEEAQQELDDHLCGPPWHPLGTMERRRVDAAHLDELERLERQLDDLMMGGET